MVVRMIDPRRYLRATGTEREHGVKEPSGECRSKGPSVQRGGSQRLEAARLRVILGSTKPHDGRRAADTVVTS